jgi:hypothetical protein
MKLAPQTVQIGRHVLPAREGGCLQAEAALRLLGLSLPADWAAFQAQHHLRTPAQDFGAGPEAALSLPELVGLGWRTETTQARRFQKHSAALLARVWSGDVALSAEIAERNPEPQARGWLHARLDNQQARKRLMSAVARQGGQGLVYGQLGSISNRSVLGMDSASLRRERGVRVTRDGLDTSELLRLSYLESVTAHALEQGQAQGNEAILELHRQHAERERQAWGQGRGGASGMTSSGAPSTGTTSLGATMPAQIQAGWTPQRSTPRPHPADYNAERSA